MRPVDAEARPPLARDLTPILLAQRTWRQNRDHVAERKFANPREDAKGRPRRGAHAAGPT